MKGLIFDIRHYAVHDGPGIRTTVFMKGCPLACHWCHNPESQLEEAEQIISRRRIGERIFDEQEQVGLPYSPMEVIREVEKSRLFFDESGGGVTFSGGEPLLQPLFLRELLLLCREREIHTALDTCGYAPMEVVRDIAALTDLLLWDLKLMDPQKHIQYTGVSNQLILNNLRSIAQMGKQIWLRMPVIPEVNDTDQETALLLSLLDELYPAINRIHLLPYHGAALSKYKRLAMSEKRYLFRQPSGGEMERLKERLERSGFTVNIGG